MNIPYRTRQRIKRVAIITVITLLVLALVWLCWFIWLKRYIVYTREGAVLDFSLSAKIPEGQPAQPPEQLPTIPIYYNEGEDAISTSRELQQLKGYYADRNALLAGIDQVSQQVKALERGTPVMLDVKSATGNFYYSTGVSEFLDSKIDITAMDALIQELSDSGVYLIARLPALRDRMYGLNNVNDGVFDTRGAYLYRDDGGCYWLNPKRQNVLTYLVQTINELEALGFDEVVLDYFDFPETQYMRFDGDKEQTLIAAAQTLMTSCGSDTFAVSFVQDPGFTMPEGRTRLYLKDASAAEAQNLALQTGLENPQTTLVFLTEIHDTRFDEFSVLRPLDAAH